MTTPTTLFHLPGASPLRRVGPGVRALLAAAPPPVLALLAILFIQLGAALATTLFPGLGITGTAAVRLSFAALVLNLMWRPRMGRLTRQTWLLAGLFGLSLAGLNLFFYQAISRLPLGVVVTVEFLGPLGVAVASSRRAREFLWVLLAAAGILLLAPLGDVRFDALGFVFALAAGGCWAAYIVFGGRLGRHLPGGEGLALAMTVGALLLLPFGVVSAGGALLQPKWLALGLLVALVSTVIPFSLEYEAMRRMSSRAFGVLLSSEPAIAALVGILLLGDQLGLRHLLALACISAAAAGSTLGEKV